jgi:hypothetical protein
MAESMFADLDGPMIIRAIVSNNSPDFAARSFPGDWSSA